MSSDLPIIALTAGDVAGIGPEIILRALADPRVHDVCRPLVLCHPQILARVSEVFDDVRPPEIVSLDTLPDRETLASIFQQHGARDKFVCLHSFSDDAVAVSPGTVDSAAGEVAYRYLTTAAEFAKSKVVDAIATAPLNKAALHAAGHNFPGHTEILAETCGVTDFGMMLYLPESRIAPLRKLIVSPTTGDPDQCRDLADHHGLSVVHVTLHTSVASVPSLLSMSAVEEKIRLLESFLGQLGCHRKSIGVAALNPHGGENGLFGNEESRIIEPAVERSRSDKVNVSGPIPVDTLIRRAVAGEFDGVVAMYHDQGHIPVKLIGFDSAVNITLGLPIIRTSPTHGTAFDRAWNPATPSDASGMVEAILAAAQLYQARR